MTFGKKLEVQNSVELILLGVQLPLLRCLHRLRMEPSKPDCCFPRRWRHYSIMLSLKKSLSQVETSAQKASLSPGSKHVPHFPRQELSLIHISEPTRLLSIS